jgi:hypothetical protein
MRSWLKHYVPLSAAGKQPNESAQPGLAPLSKLPWRESEMGFDNLIWIAAAEAEDAARERAGEPVEARARAAMEAVQDHWILRDEDGQFKAALVGLLRSCSPEETERVEAEVRKMGRLAAMLTAAEAGVPVDLEGLAAQNEAEPEMEPLGLVRIWREVVDGARR